MPQTISTAFYDAIFEQPSSNEQMNELEQQTLANIREVLDSPEQLSKLIPPLSNITLQLIDALKDEEADFVTFAEIIEQDPSLAINIMKVANSAKYARGNDNIQSIRKAVNILGKSGLATIATTELVKQIMPHQPIYFKMFGKHIWEHSQQCATLAQIVASYWELDEFDAHFLGLIHDVGKIVIFNALCSAFQQAALDDSPGSLAFKSLMSEMSIDMSYFIAKEWQLPAQYCNALLEQRTKRTTKLGDLLYRSNLITEVYLLQQKGKIKPEKMLEILDQVKIDKVMWQAFIDTVQDTKVLC
ncbi:HDOD domain-containing protein [Thalassotalea fusca]